MVILLSVHGEKSVAEYCTEAARNLSSFNQDEWQRLLRTVVESIIFDGNEVVIRGRIPIQETGDSGVPLRLETSLPSSSSRQGT